MPPHDDLVIPYERLYTTATNTQPSPTVAWTDSISNILDYKTIKYCYVTREELDEYTQKIYRIISEHIKLDISEDEFLKLMKE